MTDLLEQNLAIHRRQLEAERGRIRLLLIGLCGLLAILAVTVIWGTATLSELTRKHSLVLERLVDVYAPKSHKNGPLTHENENSVCWPRVEEKTL